MLRSNTVLEINIREQATRPLVQTPHPSLPRWQEQRNHIRSPLSADFFSGLLEEDFGQDSTTAVRGRRRKIMVAIVALCAGAIAALAFAWSSADGRLRLEPQSIKRRRGPPCARERSKRSNASA
jgi:hypothetical protein